MANLLRRTIYLAALLFIHAAYAAIGAHDKQTPAASKASHIAAHAHHKAQQSVLPLHDFNESFQAVRSFEQPRKPWTFFVYLAADNNLDPFASRNLADMQRVGSNNNLNIVVYLNIRLPGKSKVSKLLYIERGRILQVGPDRHEDSGSAETFTRATKTAMQQFPSHHFALVFWNHGSGDLNPKLDRAINPAELFFYDKERNKITLDRTIHFMEFLHGAAKPQKTPKKRGICFDDTYKTYLDDKKLMKAFAELCKQHGKKLDMVIFDACLMAGVATTWIMSHFADYMVGSEEVVLGPGYDYHSVIRPLAEGTIDPYQFSQHIVQCYERTYATETDDYTHSALSLASFPRLNANINDVAKLLKQGIDNDKNGSFRAALDRSHEMSRCTVFDEPSYVDLHHLYRNMSKEIKKASRNTTSQVQQICNRLKNLLHEGIKTIEDVVVTHTEGPNVQQARGIYIFFPQPHIYRSYYESFYATEFAKNNAWSAFLKAYLARNKTFNVPLTKTPDVVN